MLHGVVLEVQKYVIELKRVGKVLVLKYSLHLRITLEDYNIKLI